MPLPRQIGAYPLEKEILDIILTRNEPMDYELATAGEAVHFRQRLNRFRQLARDQGDHRYDRLVFGWKSGSRVINFDFVKAKGFLRNAKGEEVPVIVRPTKPEHEVTALVHRIDEWLDQAEVDRSILDEEDK